MVHQKGKIGGKSELRPLEADDDEIKHEIEVRPDLEPALPDDHSGIVGKSVSHNTSSGPIKGTHPSTLNPPDRIDWKAVYENIAPVLTKALEDDLGTVGDVTTNVQLGDANPHITARLSAEESVVACGIAIGQLFMAEHGPDVKFTAKAEDGQRLESGDVLLELKGPAKTILKLERTLLDTLMIASGIATTARQFVDAVPEGSRTKVLDTRKVIPGLVHLSKAATRVGGAENHRFGLKDGFMAKDNHLSLAGISITETLKRAREALGDSMTIVLEVESLDQLDEALGVRPGYLPDVIILDNFYKSDGSGTEKIREAIRRRNAKAKGVQLEISGGVRLEDIPAIARTNVDRVSVGAMTHSVRSAELHLEREDADPE